MSRRIGGPGGGSDPGPRKRRGGVVVAVGVALALGGGGVTATSGALSPGVSASPGSNPGLRINTRVGYRNSSAAQARLTARGLQVRVRATDDSSNCVANSYGQTQQFFREHPCVGLHRAQFELRDRNGDVLLVPVAWVEMPTNSDATALQKLVDTDGTGNVTELSRQRGRYRSIRYTGDVYASHRDENIVVIGQAQPVARRWVGLATSKIVADVVR